MVNLSEQLSGGAPADGSLAAGRGSSPRDVGFEPNTELLGTAQDLLDTLEEFEGSLPDNPGGGSGRPEEDPPREGPTSDPPSGETGGSNPPQKAGSGGLGTLLAFGAAGGAAYLTTRSETEE